MTKQEQIEELKNILLEESNRFYGLECDEACAYCEASAVYDAGYRKESKNYIGTGRYCLDKMGFTNVKYYAFEIDKYAKQIAMSNYPDIIQCGDAFQVREDNWTICKR